MAKKFNISVIDFETDPFEFGAEIAPFCAGFYDGKNYEDFWGDDCMVRLVEFLHTLKTPHYIYAHNGGKFDFVFLLRAGMLDNPIKIIHGRIVSAKIGIHTIRDSFSILPVPLSAHKKDDIDYNVMKRSQRDKYKADILHYLAKDCEYLHEFVMGFIERFGIKLTAPSMAYSELKKITPQVQTNESFDNLFRQYYYGGRVEFFEQGIIDGDFKVYDVNSMYPFVMKTFNHPKGANCVATRTKPDARGFLPGILADKVYFAEIEAISEGALPLREKTGLSFPHSRSNSDTITFLACSHEIQAGLETGRLKAIKYKAIWFFSQSQTLGDFVDVFYEERLQAKANGDKSRDLLAKLVLNSAYGKFGMNPREFYDYVLSSSHVDGFECYADYGDFSIWRRPAPVSRFNNVAIAASITSAARATLMRGMASAERVIYCDTDSLICAGMDVSHSASKLGDWKLEAECTRAAIAGKKLYALFDSEGECVKLASKGVRLSPADIIRVCKGETVSWKKESPSLGLSGATKYIQRDVKMT